MKKMTIYIRLTLLNTARIILKSCVLPTDPYFNHLNHEEPWMPNYHICCITSDQSGALWGLTRLRQLELPSPALPCPALGDVASIHTWEKLGLAWALGWPHSSAARGCLWQWLTHRLLRRFKTPRRAQQHHWWQQIRAGSRTGILGAIINKTSAQWLISRAPHKYTHRLTEVHSQPWELTPGGTSLRLPAYSFAGDAL